MSTNSEPFTTCLATATDKRKRLAIVATCVGYTRTCFFLREAIDELYGTSYRLRVNSDHIRDIAPFLNIAGSSSLDIIINSLANSDRLCMNALQTFLSMSSDGQARKKAMSRALNQLNFRLYRAKLLALPVLPTTTYAAPSSVEALLSRLPPEVFDIITQSATVKITRPDIEKFRLVSRCFRDLASYPFLRHIKQDRTQTIFLDQDFPQNAHALARSAIYRDHIEVIRIEIPRTQYYHPNIHTTWGIRHDFSNVADTYTGNKNSGVHAYFDHALQILVLLPNVKLLEVTFDIYETAWKTSPTSRHRAAVRRDITMRIERLLGSPRQDGLVGYKKGTVVGSDGVAVDRYNIQFIQ